MRRGMIVLVGLVLLLAGPGTAFAMERDGAHAPEPAHDSRPPAVGAAAAPHGGAGSQAPAVPAAASHGRTRADGHGGGPGGGHAMPVWKFFLIQLAGFALLVLVVVRFAWPGIRKGLDARREGLAEAFRKAEADERESQRQVTEYQDRLRAFAMEAKRRRDEAVRQGRMMRLQIEEEARIAARQMLEKARRERELMSARARAEVRKAVLLRAFDEASAALRREVDDRKQAALIDRFVTELETMTPPA